MPNLDLPTAWISDLDVLLSAADFNQLRDICVMLDGLTFRRMNVTNSTGSQQSDHACADWHSAGDYQMGAWGLRYTTGMTTLTILGKCATQIDIYLDGVFNSSQAASASFSKAITLTTYPDGSIIVIQIFTVGNPDNDPRNVVLDYQKKYIIWDMYGSPVVTASTWPGVPTFAGTYSGTLLNQLRDAAQYIWDRVCAIPILPNNASIMLPSTHKVETQKMFFGAVGRYTTTEVLRVNITATGANTAEHYEIWYNGSLAVTGATFTVDQTITASHSIALTHTIGTRVEIEIRAVCTDASNQDANNTHNARYTFSVIRSEAPSGGYTSAAPPTAWTAEESITATTWNTRLNALATMLSNAKARLDARPEQWNRAPAFRKVFAGDDHEIMKNFRRHAAIFSGRQGDTLIVRGKGVKVAWGLLSVDDPGMTGDTPNPVDYSKFHWAHEVSVGGDVDDQIVTSEIRLDALEGLEPDVTFYVYSSAVLAWAGTFISRG